MQARSVSIGEAARRTGVKIPTIRYYEAIGILPAPARAASNWRGYDVNDLGRLAFVRHARELGFAIADIRDLLALATDQNRPCAAADAIARRHLVDVKRRIVSLRALQSELERMVRECSGTRVSDCRIINILGDHDLCLHPTHRTASKA